MIMNTFYSMLRSRTPVFIDICWAKAHISCELLQLWCSPSSKRFKVTKSLKIVIVSVPQRNLGCCCASRGTSEDTLPHGQWRINADTLSLCSKTINKRQKEVTVGSGTVSRPRASWGRISLDINPYRTIKISGNSTHQAADLGGWIFSSARKHVNISGKSCRSGIVEVANGICI